MKAMAVLNVGGRSIHPKSRQSFLSACERWGCQFVEFTEPLAECHHFWQKAFAINMLTQFSQVLQLDADMLIRWDAPSPFDLVPESHIGVVSSRQFTPPPRDFAVAPATNGERAGMVISRHRDACVRKWASRMGLEPCSDEKHLNGGFFLYSPQIHAALFETLRSVGENAGWNQWKLPEQASLSVLLHNLDVKQVWLPVEWNTVAARQAHRPEHNTGYMNAYIYHFTGKVDRSRRISSTRWEKSPCDEIAQRLSGESPAWAEIGVADGYNAAAVLARVPHAKTTLVDKWGVATTRYRNSGDLAAKLGEKQWQIAYNRAISLTKKNSPTVLRLGSVEAASRVEDESLDLVYIDGEHTREAVQEDIAAWLPKVRCGGWIGGHDYDHPMESRRGLWGVKAAVDEAFGSSISLGECGTWFHQKPS